MMVSDSYQKMISDVARSMVKNGDYGGEDLGVLRRQQQEVNEREREVARLRSGSAPPTVEGSITAFGGLYGGGSGRGFGSEEELRADPSYANYYYMNVNLNPRLPPPLVSKEDWRYSQQRVSMVGGIGDRRRVNGEGGDDGGHGERSIGSEWGGQDGLIGLPPALGIGSRQRSIAEMFQVRVQKIRFFFICWYEIDTFLAKLVIGVYCVCLCVCVYVCVFLIYFTFM